MAGRKAILLLVGCLAAGGRMHAQPTAPALVNDEVDTAPVEIDGTVLFRVRGVSSFPAAVRARAITDRIVAAAADAAVAIDSLRVIDAEGGLRIAAGDRPIMTVVDADASLEQVGRAELVYAHLNRVRQAIVEFRAARSSGALQVAAVNTLVATIVLAAGTALLLWSWRRLDALLTRRLQARIQSVGIQSFEVMRADRIWAALRSGLVGIRTVIFLAGALIYVGTCSRSGRGPAACRATSSASRWG